MNNLVFYCVKGVLVPSLVGFGYNLMAIPVLLIYDTSNKSVRFEHIL